MIADLFGPRFCGGRRLNFCPVSAAIPAIAQLMFYTFEAKNQAFHEK
jgi:hypothetical protein